MSAFHMRDIFTTKQAVITQFFVAIVVFLVTLAIKSDILRWPSFWAAIVAVALNIFIIMWATAKCRSFYEEKMGKKNIIKTIQITAVQLLATALMGVLIMYSAGLYDGNALELYGDFLW